MPNPNPKIPPPGPGKPKGSKNKNTLQAEALGIAPKKLRSLKDAARVKFETILENANILMEDMQARAYEDGRPMSENEAKTFTTQLDAYKTTITGKDIELNIFEGVTDRGVKTKENPNPSTS